MHRYFDLYAHVQEKKTPGVFFFHHVRPHFLDPYNLKRAHPSRTQFGPHRPSLQAACVLPYSSIYGVFISNLRVFLIYANKL